MLGRCYRRPCHWLVSLPPHTPHPHTPSFQAGRDPCVLSPQMHSVGRAGAARTGFLSSFVSGGEDLLAQHNPFTHQGISHFLQGLGGQRE